MVLELSLKTTLLGAALLLTALIWYKLSLYPRRFSPLRNIPGPDPASLITGNLPEVFAGDAAKKLQEWTERYGPAFQYRNFFGSQQLYLSDPKALAHIMLHHPSRYPKPKAFRRELEETAGRGLTFVEGDDHRRQRRLLNFPFVQASVHAQQPLFQEGAEKLCSKLASLVASGSGLAEKWTVIDVCPWLSRATLDIMGVTGFNYDFQALEHEDNPLVRAMHEMLKPHDPKLEDLLASIESNYLPFLPKLKTELHTTAKRCFDLMAEECRGLLEQRMKQAEMGELEDKKDLLSIVVKANLETENKRDMLFDDELKGLLSTFIVAGHETTATSLAWALCYLAKNPSIQTKLREELQSAKSGSDSALTADELGSLPYLDAVVREVLRCAPPILFTLREATEDDVLPLSEPISGKNGELISSIQIKKGQPISIGIYNINHSKQIFGKDADEFMPERWLAPDGELENVRKHTRGFSAWSSIMTFYGGARSCIGYRYAVLKMKTLLSALVEEFEFAERDEQGTPITRRSNLVWGPVVEGEPLGGAQLPLRIRSLRKL